MDQGKVKSEKKTHYSLSVRMTLEQFERFRQGFAASTDTSMSHYGIKLLLGKPVRIYYRERAFVEFTEAAILFRKDASLIIQHAEWTEAEKMKLEGMFEKMYQLHIKIHEHVRQNKKNTKGL